MRRNEAAWDRVIRFLAGLTAVTTGSVLLEPGLTAAALAIAGSILIVTGLVGWCPLYAVLGVRTLRPRPGEET